MATIYLGRGKNDVYLRTNMLNRHGLIAGATGTGKTSTLKVIVEAAAEMGIPVIMPDVKGDLFSLSRPGSMNDKLSERLAFLGRESYDFRGFDIHIWDILGKSGIPMRVSVSEMGPLLLSNLLELNDVQTGILNIAFKVADEEGLLLLDFKDLAAMLQYLLENRKELIPKYGNISSQSIGAIRRAMLVLENEGAESFFAEPPIDIEDLFTKSSDGSGMINIINAKVLYTRPKLYTTVMLWILSELYEHLPEVGDLEQPKLLFFFDEAHLLFSYGSKALKEKVLQIIKLIRSKGVGVFFVTQSPADIPSEVLAQLGNKVQHSLRAFTPKDRKMIKETAENFRMNPDFDTAEVLTNMESGEALVSVLDEEGLPTITEKTVIVPPRSSFETLSEEEVRFLFSSGSMFDKYHDSYDSLSAFEMLEQKNLEKEEEEERARREEETRKEEEEKRKEEIKKDQDASRAERMKRRKKSEIEKAGGRMLNSAIGSIGREIGRKIVRGLLGTINKK